MSNRRCTYLSHAPHEASILSRPRCTSLGGCTRDLRNALAHVQTVSGKGPPRMERDWHQLGCLFFCHKTTLPTLMIAKAMSFDSIKHQRSASILSVHLICRFRFAPTWIPICTRTTGMVDPPAPGTRSSRLSKTSRINLRTPSVKSSSGIHVYMLSKS